MIYPTLTRRTLRNEIEIRTNVPLEGRRVLHITTRKASARNKLTTSATVVETDEKNPEWFTYRMFVDFSKNLRLGEGRATEKALRDQHHAALFQLPDLLTEIAAFYKALDAKEAAAKVTA